MIGVLMIVVGLAALIAWCVAVGRGALDGVMWLGGAFGALCGGFIGIGCVVVLLR